MSSSNRHSSNGVKYLQFVYTWSVKNVSNMINYKPGECTDSPKFMTQMNGQYYVWQIELYPNGYNDEHEGWMSMFLVLQGGSRTSIDGCYIVSVVGENYEEIKPEESDEAEFRLDDGIGHDRYLQMNIRQLKSHGFLQNSNTLVLQYRINLSTTGFEPTDPLQNSEPKLGRTSKSNRMHELFKTIESPKKAEFDFIITAGDWGKFYCHREILSEASSTMERLTRPETYEEEDETQEIKLEKIPTATLREVLRFIYCGRATMDKSNVDKKELLKLAAEWNLKGLIIQCEEATLYDLRPDNAVRALIDAQEYNMPTLKDKSVIEILTNMSIATRTKDWNKLMTKPNLIKEIFRAGPIAMASYTGKHNPSSNNNKQRQERLPPIEKGNNRRRKHSNVH